MENFETFRLDQTGQQTQAILDQVSTNTADIAQLRALYEALTQSEPVIIQPSDTWPVADPQENVIYRVIDRVNTPPQSYSDYMWNGTAMVLMATYNNSIDNEPTPGSNNLVKSGGVAASIVFDISAYNATGSTLATYSNLAAALGTDGANVPASVRKGGMSVKFVNSSDSKYVQCRLMAQSFTTDITQWQGIDNILKKGSENLIESGAVFKVTGGGFEPQTIQLTPAISKNNYAINPSGAPITSTDWCYKIYDVSNINVINIVFSHVYLQEALLWGTYTELNNEDIDSSLLVRKKNWADLGAPCNETIVLFGNEKYIAISNKISSFVASGVNGTLTITLTERTENLHLKTETLHNKVNNLENSSGDGLENIQENPTSLYIKTDKAIAPAGNVVSASGYEYKIYEIKYIKSVNIAFSVVNLGDCILWATLSKLTNNDISAEDIIRKKVWPQSSIGQACDENIVFDEDEKYLVISNRTNNYPDSSILATKYQTFTTAIQVLQAGLFAGMSVVALGDSITWQGGDNCNNNNGWTKWFHELAKNWNMKSYARSGATWTNTENTTYNITEDTGVITDDNVIYNQINRLINAYDNSLQSYPDLIIIAAGTNDAWYPNARPYVLSKTVAEVFAQESLGAYITSKNVNTVTSLAEAVRYGCEMLLQKFPKTKIVLLTPLQSTAFTVERREAIAEIIRGCANQMGLQSIRQDENCGIYRVQESVSYYKTIDGTHLSEIGAKCVGYTLFQIIKGIIN